MTFATTTTRAMVLLPISRRGPQFVAAHGSEVVSGIRVTTGFTGGNTLSALLRSIKVNGTEYVFGAA